ncbi:MAG: helix-turn-helix domain-containing protein [Pseudomonadota bacterium]
MSPRSNKFVMCDESNCAPIREILDRVGDKWSLYIIASLYGGALRFNEIKREVDGISQRMLTLTLRSLERDGLLTRTVSGSASLRVDYELTVVGRSLRAPIVELITWAIDNRGRMEKARSTYDKASAKNAAPSYRKAA